MGTPVGFEYRNGALYAEGVALEDIAQRHGTPCYVYSRTSIVKFKEYTATIKAITRLDTLRITKAQFLQLLTEFPELSIEIMKILAMRLGATTTELSEARVKLRALGVPGN